MVTYSFHKCNLIIELKIWTKLPATDDLGTEFDMYDRKLNGPIFSKKITFHTYTAEPAVGGHPLCKKKWSPTGGGLSWEVLYGNKRA